MPTAEHRRLLEITDDIYSWRRWGPYLSDRAWATVREDYSADGDAWTYLPHALARSKAYRWGEDGIAGICDRYQLLCFAPAFWNGRDPFLKERLFGLTPLEGNHGEDVKEYYFHLDNTPTHSYMKFLYKYPHKAFPYDQLVETNRAAGGKGPEFELVDTGVFAENRYFDIVIEYAKADPEDICIRIEAFNRGPDAAVLHILPHLWFRNTWAWRTQPGPEPVIRPGSVSGGEKGRKGEGEKGSLAGGGFVSLLTDDSGVENFSNVPVHYRLGPRTLYGCAGGQLLFTNNETNMERVFGSSNGSRSRFVKDAFHRWVIHQEDCLNPDRVGTKTAIHYHFPAVPAGGSVVVRLRLVGAGVNSAGGTPAPQAPQGQQGSPLAMIDDLVAQRRTEADEFYQQLHKPGMSEDERRVQRQALAGLLWSKQSYLFDVDVWLKGDFPDLPPPASRSEIRNEHWKHLNSMRVMTLPDKWEYPWFAAWDLAFQCIALALVDGDFAKEQLWQLLLEEFQHPNGQLPAYEWEFSDLNPPVHAWAVWRVYNMDRIRSGRADRRFLERCFHKLLINFAWWINKVDREGNNIFEGGFLGLDNISFVDRSTVCCQDGAVLEQADATGWMGMFCLNMMRIALELAKENNAYESLATKFFQHYAYIASAMKHMGGRDFSLWDEQDGFFYDVLRCPKGTFRKFSVRSLVGIIPLFAVERLEIPWIKPFKEFTACLNWFLNLRKDLVEDVVHTVENNGVVTHALTIVNQEQIVRILSRVWDPGEFLSDHGVRSLSKYHEQHPFHFADSSVGYEPAEAAAKIKGGNSNWRGPIWLPTNFLLIESLRKLGKAFGTSLTVPTAGKAMTLNELARDLAERLMRLFVRDRDGRRPYFGDVRMFQEDPHWRDNMLFYEYFHGDHGKGLGASHQTGWTALVASLLDEWR